MPDPKVELNESTDFHVTPPDSDDGDDAPTDEENHDQNSETQS